MSVLQHRIREHELFVSGGVHEVPAAVFERNGRASGERRERGQYTQLRRQRTNPGSVVLGTIVVNHVTGELRTSKKV